ncbi:MAG: hypothetical protein GWP59_07760 [Chlamydiales bacterium]|nr:hypothetical protein [Chlamydiales bacterium]
MQLLKFRILFSILPLLFLTFHLDAAEFPKERFFPINHLNIEYLDDYPSLPPAQALSHVEVALKKTEEGFVAPTLEDLQDPDSLKLIQTFSLSKVDEFTPVQLFSESAINYMSRKIVETINALGIVGIYVSVDTDQITVQGEDIRAMGDNALTLYVAASTVAYIKAVDIDDEGEEQEIESDEAKRILDMSPIADPEESMQSPLIERQKLEDYIFSLNRHPARRVDVRIRPEGENEASVHFLIRQMKPWRFIYNASNAADQRFNNQLDFIHYQLTGKDDTLKLSGSTTDFIRQRSHIMSYETPFGNDALRNRIEFHWNYSEFTHDIEGFQNTEGDSKDILGKQFSVGGRMESNIFQHRDFFADIVLDTTYRSIKSNTKIGDFGWVEARFFMPELSLTLSKSTAIFTFFHSFSFQKNFPELANTKRRQVNALGRGPGPDQVPGLDMRPGIFKWNTFFSFFLEPFTNPLGWNDPSTPESSTLAHELAFTTNGQFTNESRLAPQYKYSAGGIYSVRGYPKSMDSGDIGFVVNLEYKFHLPRTFNIQPAPEFSEMGTTSVPFKWAPSFVYDQPDWDLILKTYIDYGRLINNGRKEVLPAEHNTDLLSWGLGAELMIKNYLQARADWGLVLQAVKRHDIGQFYNRFHISLSLVY